MEKINLSSTLLVPKANPGSNISFYWLGSVTCTDENMSNHVDIILFNCNSILDIIRILQKELEELNKCEQVPDVTNQVNYILNLLSMLADTCYQKKADENLLRLVSRNLAKSLTNEGVIYLSGVGSIG